jgi:OPT oligopeptide transporter protein
MSQALQFTSDMKLGHYMKVPPRTMFLCQIVAAVVAGTTQLGIQKWYVVCLPESTNQMMDDFLDRMFANISNFCEPHQSDRWVITVGSSEL